MSRRAEELTFFFKNPKCLFLNSFHKSSFQKYLNFSPRRNFLSGRWFYEGQFLYTIIRCISIFFAYVLQRFARLIGLLNRLSVSFYELSPVDLGEGRKFHPGSISNVELDNTWFLNQVKRYCCSISQPKERTKLVTYFGFLVCLQNSFSCPFCWIILLEISKYNLPLHT